MPPKLIVTARLQLEASEPRHLSSMRVAIESSLPELRQWMPWAIDDSEKNTREFLEGAVRAWEAGTGWTFTVTLESEVIGTIGIDAYRPLSASAELGYWMSSGRTGQGFATEAASALVTFGFEDLQLHRLQLLAGTQNIASQRVAEKIGFQRMGMVRQAERGAEGFYDCYVYDLLATDARPT